MAQKDNLAAQCPVNLGHKCELCETKNIKFQCQNCDELMCETCKKAHLKSKASKNHKMVCLISPEMYELNQTGTNCPSHTEEDLLMFCNTCDYPICRQCIASGVHLNHPMVRVEEVIDSKQQQLSNIIRQTNEISQRYKVVLETITGNKMQFSKAIVKTIKEIKARNKKLKIKLDKIESEYIQQLENKDKENKEAIAELEQRLQEEITDVNELIQQCECKQRERNTEMVQFVTDVMQRVDKYTICEQPDEINPPDLIVRDVDDQELKALFGCLDMKTKPELKQQLQRHKNVEPAIPVTNIKIISSFFCGYHDCVVTTGFDHAFSWKCGYIGLSMMTSDGKVRQDIMTDFNVFDVAVSTSGNLFVTEHYGNKVKKLTRDNTITDIYTTTDGYETGGITVTDTGNVLVVLYKKINIKIVDITTSEKNTSLQYSFFQKITIQYIYLPGCSSVLI